MPDPGGTPEPTVGELVRDLGEQTSRLVRDEVALATAELREDARHAGAGVGLFGGAGVVALYGVGALVAAAVAGLAEAVDVWLAALIVAVALFAVAGAAALIGKRQVAQVGPPERTVENVKRDVAAVRGQHR